MYRRFFTKTGLVTKKKRKTYDIDNDIPKSKVQNLDWNQRLHTTVNVNYYT